MNVGDRFIQRIVESSIANQLEELDLSDFQFPDEHLETEQLAGRSLPNLRRLSLSGCRTLSIHGLRKILQLEMPLLEYLNLKNFGYDVLRLEELLALLLKRVPHLRKLELSSNLVECNTKLVTNVKIIYHEPPPQDIIASPSP